METEIRQRSRFLDTAVEAARQAGARLVELFGRLQGYDLKTSHHDLVTEGDRAAEQLICAMIRDAFPEHGILSEESPPVRTGAPARWVIDPLDGTTNYAHGLPFFCVSIALEVNSKLVVGVIYDPLREELFTAVVGEGARLNGQPIRVSAVRELKESLLTAGFPHKETLRERNLAIVRTFLPAAQSVRRLGSAALALAYVACGRLEGYWDLDLKPWDLAAGALLVGEAGGSVSAPTGEDFSIENPELVASNGQVHRAMLAAMQIGGSVNTR